MVRKTRETHQERLDGKGINTFGISEMPTAKLIPRTHSYQMDYKRIVHKDAALPLSAVV